MGKSKKQQSEIIADFIKLITELPKVYEASVAAMKTEDKLTQDLLHEIELNGNNRKERNKAATQLRVNRLDRRYYKDRMEEAEPIHDFLQDKDVKKVMNKLEQVLGKVRKVEAYHADRKYHPRVNRMKEGQ